MSKNPVRAFLALTLLLVICSGGLAAVSYVGITASSLNSSDGLLAARYHLRSRSGNFYKRSSGSKSKSSGSSSRFFRSGR